MKRIIKTLFSPDCYKLILLLVSIAHVCPLLGGQIDNYLKLLHIYSAAVIVFDLLGERRILKNKGRTILFVFVLCYGITLLCNPNLLGFSGLSNFCYYFACLALVYSYGENSAKWDRITAAVVVALVTAANLVGIWMFYAKTFIVVPERGYIGMYPSQNRLAGLFGNPNVLGVICLATICLCALQISRCDRCGRKVLYALAGAVNFITLLLANSRTQIYSLIFLCMLLVFLRIVRDKWSTKRVLIALLAAVLAGAMVYYGYHLIQHILSWIESLIIPPVEVSTGDTIQRLEDELPLNGRVEIWKKGWKVFLYKPLFGAGMDNYTSTLAEMGVPDLAVGGNMHNTYLEVLVAFGLAGFSCLLVFLFVILREALHFFRYCDKEKRKQGVILLACVASFALDAVADSTLMASVYPTSTAFWFIASQIVHLLESENQKSGHFRPEPLGVWTDRLFARLGK